MLKGGRPHLTIMVGLQIEPRDLNFGSSPWITLWQSCVDADPTLGILFT